MGIFGNSEEKAAEKAARKIRQADMKAKVDEAREEYSSIQDDIFRLESLLREVSQNTLQANSHNKWEYMYKDDINESDLNFYGLHGWELVNLTSFTTGYGLGGNDTMTVHMRYLFKRPLCAEIATEAQVLIEMKKKKFDEKAVSEERVKSLVEASRAL